MTNSQDAAGTPRVHFLLALLLGVVLLLLLTHFWSPAIPPVTEVASEDERETVDEEEATEEFVTEEQRLERMGELFAEEADARAAITAEERLERMQDQDEVDEEGVSQTSEERLQRMQELLDD